MTQLKTRAINDSDITKVITSINYNIDKISVTQFSVNVDITELR